MEKTAKPGITMALLLTSVLVSTVNIQPVKASGTIYIKADGSVDPPEAPISSVDDVAYTSGTKSVVTSLLRGWLD